MPRILSVAAAVTFCFSGAAFAAPVTILETFDRFGEDVVVSDQLPGLTVVAHGDGEARTIKATDPVNPSEPIGLHNTAIPAFRFALMMNFDTAGSQIGALIDFGTVGGGVRLDVYNDLDGMGTLLGSAMTAAEGLLMVSADGIKSAVFSANGGLATWLIDDLTYTYEAQPVPGPGSATLFMAGLAGCGFLRRRVIA